MLFFLLSDFSIWVKLRLNCELKTKIVCIITKQKPSYICITSWIEINRLTRKIYLIFSFQLNQRYKIDLFVTPCLKFALKSPVLRKSGILGCLIILQQPIKILLIDRETSLICCINKHIKKELKAFRLYFYQHFLLYFKEI